jgi:peptide/nickel transport system permease protein
VIAYLLRRLLLLPPTLFCILLVNFVIINLAPGDPTTVTDISPEAGAVRKSSSALAFGGDMRYLQFREFYGLTLPILLNTWPFLSQSDVDETLKRLDSRHENGVEIPFKTYEALRLELGDQARFIMPKLKAAMMNQENPESMRNLAAYFFVRGGTRQAIVNPQLTVEERAYNDRIAENNRYLMEHVKDIPALNSWFEKNAQSYGFLPSTGEKWHSLFFETRFFRYMTRVLTIDFGNMRNDSTKTVISEVTKRIKYSLTLSVFPMFLTFFLCQLFGFYMAYFHNGLSDRFLSVFFLILYAIPVFVVAPFLIEKIALHHTFPWNGEPIPISGFSSPEAIYEQKTSLERLKDILQHLLLPFVAVMYGSLAAQTRLSRTAVLEVMRQDYVRTARAKGLSTWEILFKHVGRNAGITIITSLAASLGAILGGALIVETLFEINGFGKFFYDAIVNRDFNVILFSAIAGSFLALLGYVVADLFYMLLDPRVTLEKET